MLLKDKLLTAATTCARLAWKRAMALHCIPKYAMCQAERTKILGIYFTCQQKNSESWGKKKGVKIKYEVDHIIPLNNDLVCGLHVASNLQIIPQKKNTVKGNVFQCYSEKNGVITVFKGLISGQKYEKKAEGVKKNRKKPKTQQKIAKKMGVNTVKRGLTSKKQSKTVRKGLKTVKNVKNSRKLYKKG